MDITANTYEEIIPSFSSSQIVQFYEARSIFITGATGFLGTVLIEKLLFTCQNLKNIYVLMKEKRGNTIEKRLADMLESQAFHRIKQHRTDSITKIIPIGGDLVKHNLGMKKSDIDLIQNEVSIVFHVAANISFNKDLHDTININTKATEKLINICKNMPHLAAFVYVSSGFSQSQRLIVDETLYDNTVPVEKVYELLEMPKSQKHAVNLLEGRPNVYAYSKALAEEIINKYADQIPAAIVRPTLIISAMQEPLPGWITSWAGPTAIVEAAGRGLLMCWNSDAANVIDLVPVDYVANLIIATAWDTHNRRVKNDMQGDKRIKVFNYSSCTQNPIESGKFLSTCLELNKKTCGKDLFYSNQLFIFKNHYVGYWIVSTLFNILLTGISIVIDMVLWFLGQNIKMFKIQRNLAKLTLAVVPFTQRQILFLNGNVRQLYKTLNSADQKLFDFDVSHIQWEKYLRNYVVGMKKYNEPFSKKF